MKQSMRKKLLSCKEHALEEIDQYLVQVENLKALVRKLDETLALDGPRGGEIPFRIGRLASRTGHSGVSAAVLLACTDWKTAKALEQEVPALKPFTRGAITSACVRLCARGLLQRRLADHSGRPDGGGIKPYEYKLVASPEISTLLGMQALDEKVGSDQPDEPFGGAQ